MQGFEGFSVFCWMGEGVVEKSRASLSSVMGATSVLGVSLLGILFLGSV